MVNNGGIGWSWEEPRGPLAPTHHGTALELLSSRAAAVPRVLCLRRRPRSDAVARRAVDVLGSSVTRSRTNEGTRVWMFAAAVLRLVCSLSFHKGFTESLYIS